MFTKTHPKPRSAGFTLIEILFFVVLTTIVLVAGVALAQNFIRTVAFLTNSVDLDTKSRLAADRMSQEIRQCDRIQSASSSSLVWRLGTNLTSYVYYPETRELIRSTAQGDEKFLTGCDYVRFDLFQRQTAAGLYDVYPRASSPTNCKVVQLNWVCSRTLLGFKANSTTMESGKVVIRKQ